MRLVSVCVALALTACIGEEGGGETTILGGDAGVNGPGQGGAGGGVANGGGSSSNGGGSASNDGGSASNDGGEPSNNGGEPSNNGGEPSNNGGEPSNNGGEPSNNGGEPSNNGGEPSNNGGEPSNNGGAGGEPVCVPDCDGRECGSDGCGDTCGSGCAAGEVCADGRCNREGCPDDQIDCDGECSTLLDDVAHCGNCRTACPDPDEGGALAVCLEAECYVTCRGHEREPRSIDFDHDPENCGRCGNECEGAFGGEPLCAGGRCQDPCGGEDELCQGRCVRPDEIGENCEGGCCPVVRPGIQNGEPLRADRARAYTIEVDGPHRIVARLRLEDGSCPGFDSPFSNANESVFLQILGVDALTNRPALGRGRAALGDGDWCIQADAQVMGGAYEVVLQPRIDLPAYELEISVEAGAPARNGVADRTGIYAEPIPEDDSAVIPMRLARSSRVLILGMADQPNPDHPEACLYGDLFLNNDAGEQLADNDDFCPLIEAFLPPGDYNVVGRRTFDDEDPSFRAVIFIEAIGGDAVQPLPDGGFLEGGALGELEAQRYSFHLDAEAQPTLRLLGDCEDAGFTIAGSWYRSNPEDPCAEVETFLAPGDYELWVHGRRWNSIGGWSLQHDISGGVLPGGDIIDRSGSYERGAIPANGADQMTLRLGRLALVTAVTSDGAGGCPGDTTLTIESNGGQIAFDDDGNGRCSRVQVELGAGDYDLVVRGYNGGAIPAYTLDVTIQ